MKNPRILLTMFAMLPAVASAADITLTASDAFNTSSFNAAGNWSNAAAPSAGNGYFNNAFLLRTPPDANSYTFAGDSLTITGAANFAAANNEALMWKGTGITSVITIANLIVDGGQIRHGQASADSFTLAGNITVGANGAGIATQGGMIISAPISGSSQIVVMANGNGEIARMVTFASSASTFTGDLNLNNAQSLATLADNAVFNFVIGAAGVNNSIFGPGSIQLNGDFVFDLSGASTTQGDSWVIANATSQVFGPTFTVAGFTDNLDDTWSQDIGGGLSYLFSESTGTLSVVGPQSDLVWLGGGTDADAWDINTTSNWQDGLATVVYFDGDNVSFTNLGLVNPDVDITVDVAPGSVTVDSIGDYSFSGLGKITGSTGLTKTNSGQLNLGTANDYAGPTVIGGTGTVVLDIENAIPGGAGKGDTTLTSGTLDLNGYNLTLNNLSGAGTIDNTFNIDSTLTLDQTVDTTFSGLIENTGNPLAIVRSGPSTLTVSGTNTYSGGTAIGVNGTGLRVGVIRATASQALGSGTILIGDGGNDATARLELSGGISLSNNLELPVRSTGAPSIQNISGVNTLSGNVLIPIGGPNLTFQSDAGTLNLTGSAFAVEASANSRTLTFTGAGNGSVSWPISDGAALSVAVTKDGAGTWTLAGLNSYTGDTTVTAGTLVITNDDVLNNNATVSIASVATLNLTHSGTDVVGALFIAGVEQPPGVYPFGTGSLEVLDVSFSAWIAGTFTNGTVPGDQQGPHDDPDNDGISNLLEYAIAGMDPTVSDPSPGTLTGNTLSFDKRQPLAADLEYAIEESTDLGITDPWAEVAATEDDFSISYELPGGPSKDFMRLKVTQN